MGWSGCNWRNGILVNGRRFQRSHLLRDWELLPWDEEVYAGLY